MLRSHEVQFQTIFQNFTFIISEKKLLSLNPEPWATIWVRLKWAGHSCLKLVLGGETRPQAVSQSKPKWVLASTFWKGSFLSFFYFFKMFIF